MTRLRWTAGFLLAAAIVAACLPPPAAAPASVPPVVREVLAAGDPSAAPGYRLELVRYEIQPGTRLAMHRHPGMQLAWIESGTLTYTVVQGDVTVHEADGGARSVEAGQTGTIGAGEWIAEDERVVHYGENRGSSVVVILASSLLEADQPAAVPVPSASS